MQFGLIVLTVLVGILMNPFVIVSAESGPATKDGAPMVMIPAGPFPMGVPAGDRDGGRDEYPRHEVQLDSYYLDKFEVTNARYLEFVKATGHRIPQNPTNPTRNLWQGDAIPDSLTDRPVVNVDWSDADAYCKWAGKRLPTEAEWEKAARGTDGRLFPWGNETPTSKLANFALGARFSYSQVLMPVQSYESGKSPYGLRQAAGNVWEWVQDWYGANYYETSPDRNPRGPDQGQFKVVRGGSWSDLPKYLLTYGRFKLPPETRNSYTGFRCAG